MHNEMDCDVEIRVVDSGWPDTSRSERREEDRTATKTSSAALWLKTEGRVWPLRSVRVLDISPGGLSFEADGPLPVGATLELTLNTPVKDGIVARAIVRYALKYAGGCRVGVRFTEISDADRNLLDGRMFRELSAPPASRKRRRQPENWWEWNDD